MQVDLPLGVSLQDLSQLEIDQLDDELVAKLKAKEAYYRQQAAEEDGTMGTGDEEVEVKRRAQWDCQSVLSMQSNLENHPGKIADEPSARRLAMLKRNADASQTKSIAPLQFSTKTGLPLGVAGITKAHTIVEDDSDDEEEVCVNLGAARKRDESAEEKKERKAAVKELRRNARSSKKVLKQVYVAENVKAQKLATTNVQAKASITHLP